MGDGKRFGGWGGGCLENWNGDKGYCGETGIRSEKEGVGGVAE